MTPILKGLNKKVKMKELKLRRKPSFLTKCLKAMMWLAIAAVAVIAGTNAFIFAIANPHIVAQKDAKQADVIIVLGARVWTSGEPSEMLKDRLDVAYELYEAGAAKKILVSGDHGTKDYDEVNNMRRYLEGRGVPTEAVFMDHAGFDTYSTMYRARDVFVVRNAIVVTQKYHLYRAVYLADRMGLTIQGVACDRYKSLKQPYYDLRELLARSKDFFQTEIFKPLPKYLGDAIPISGSGVVTHDEEN